MSSFDQRLDGIFGLAERSTLRALAQLQLDAARDGGFNNSGLAFKIIDVIESQLRPAVEEALVSYDLATNRAFPDRARLRQSINARIETAVDVGFEKMLGGTDAFRDPWKAPLKASRAELTGRLHDIVVQHATGLAPTGVRRDFKPWYDANVSMRIGKWVVGAVAGLLAGWLLKTFLP